MEGYCTNRFQIISLTFANFGRLTNSIFTYYIKLKKMQTSTIKIDVQLDHEKVPQQISWKASDSTADTSQRAKAMMISFWDAADKSALRIDLWTKDMMVDEMADFFYQTFMTMADTYNRATQQTELAEEMKTFAKTFYSKFRDSQLSSNKL
jgi:gliding motility-associated protein GldC